MHIFVIQILKTDNVGTKDQYVTAELDLKKKKKYFDR